MLFVKPVNGLLVRDPDASYEPLPVDGKLVPNNQYWQRRLMFGEVILSDAPEPSTKNSPKKGATD